MKFKEAMIAQEGKNGKAERPVTEAATHTIDLDNRIVTWSRGAERLYGYSKAEAVGRDADSFGLSETFGLAWEVHRRMVAGLPIDSVKLVAPRKDGSYLAIALSGKPAFDTSGELVGYDFVSRDLTQSNWIAETQERLAAIIESSDDAIISKDLEGVIQAWNPGAERIFGYTAKEVVGRSVRILIPENRQDEEAEILAILRRGEKVDHFLTVRKRKDGRLIDVRVTASPIRDSEGRLIGISKIARDVTEVITARRARRFAEWEQEA